MGFNKGTNLFVDSNPVLSESESIDTLEEGGEEDKKETLNDQLELSENH